MTRTSYTRCSLCTVSESTDGKVISSLRLCSAMSRRPLRREPLQGIEGQETGSLWSNDERSASLSFFLSSQFSQCMSTPYCSGYIDNQKPQKAVELFRQMERPDADICLLLFNACAQIQTTEAAVLVKQVACRIPKEFYSNSRLVASLIDAFMKCDCLDEAQALFDQTTLQTCSMYGAMMKGSARFSNCSTDQ